MLPRLLACLLCLAAIGCTNNLGPTLENPNSVDLGAKKPGRVTSRRESADPGTSSRGTYQLYPGQQQELGDTRLDPPPGVGESDGKFTINVDRAEINEVAKLILGETLGFNYVVDPRVQGTITLASSRPLSSREVLDAFEAALRLNGAALVQTDGIVKIVALQEVLDGEMGSPDLNNGTTPGYGVSAIPLRYISPANMMELMDSFIARGGSVRASNVGNLILVRGTAAERKSLVDVVMSFDVDWMKSQTASIAILANSSPAEMVAKLEAVFATDSASSGNNALKVVPLERLNGVIIVANSREKVRRALTWVGRLDKRSVTDTNYYVYAVQNGNAADLAKILTSTFIDKSDAAGLSGEVAPDEQTVQITSNDQSGGEQGAQPDVSTQGQGAQAGKSDRQDNTSSASSSKATTESTQPDLSSGIRITPNVANNTLVIRANELQYRKILTTLRQIDAPSVQVLINTTIAEVVLNDNLRYGVQAYFKGGNASGGIFGSSGLTLKPSFPGLNFFLGSTKDPRLVLDALAAVTKVRVVSSPSILVLENETATIKVGDQVPVKTQTQTSTDSNTAVNSFEYRDTGVILKVRPRVNATGLVTMEIAQELSAVTASTGTSTTEQENPTFSQRAVNSKVSVYSTQTVVLGGLISGQNTVERDSVPGVNKIPLIGDLVGKTENTSRRTELIVFITPQIIQDGEDAARVSEELRAKMRNFSLN